MGEPRGVHQKFGMEGTGGWVAKEVKTKIIIDYEPEVFPIAEGLLILHFKSTKDCAMALKGGLWLVIGQLLAMELWESDFMPGCWSIQKMVV